MSNKVTNKVQANSTDGVGNSQASIKQIVGDDITSLADLKGKVVVIIDEAQIVKTLDSRMQDAIKQATALDGDAQAKGSKFLELSPTRSGKGSGKSYHGPAIFEQSVSGECHTWGDPSSDRGGEGMLRYNVKVYADISRPSSSRKRKSFSDERLANAAAMFS
tara:strand:- start:1733 stop:2218 length:486 start_codon:yes stop_codon:yes gene_type:complete